MQLVAIDAEQDARPPAIAVCMGCEANAVLAITEDGARLPEGWIVRDDATLPTGKAAFCPDCKPRAAPTEGDLHAIPEDAPPGGYLGCRIRYWKVHAGAVLRIHAGSAPRVEGRDEPLHFLMQPGGLRQMIADLSDILAEVEAEAQS